jgi:hypothetical protein
MSKAEHADVLEAALQMVRDLVRTGLEPRARIVEAVCAAWALFEEADCGAVEAEVDRAIAGKAAEQRAWPAVLDTDRLDRAFAALEQRGVLCLHDAGYSESSGFGETLVRRDQEGGLVSPFDAYCFYHRGDVESALAGNGLALTVGLFAMRRGDLKLARRVEHRLHEEGLRTAWDGAPDARILLPGFDFRRRGVPHDE